tara:strand:- start:5186 stop:8740 length:3555 start_codon:yes stop_codon:yes gene_type:complete
MATKGPKIKRVFENQRLFTPKVIRRYTNSSGVLKNQTTAALSGAAPSSTTGSFRYDPPGSPLKSSQQLPLDFSKFENHTFFASAESNVNIAFEKIVNQFPFDGTREEYENFLDDLTGFEKFVLDSFPSYMGYLTFTSALTQSVEIKDRAGVLFPSLSKIRSAKTVLNPLGNSFSVGCRLFLPTITNNKQVIFSHMSDAGVGYAAFLDSGTSSSATLNFAVISGSQHVSASYSLAKGKFHFLNFIYDRRAAKRYATIMSASTEVARSKRFKFESLSTGGASFFIATGSAMQLGSSTFTPAETFSGSLDEFRVFSVARKPADINYYEQRTMFARDDLKLSFRFNEPTGSYTNNDVLLDHSGMSLHARITNFDKAMRAVDEDNVPPMLFEASVKHPVLFPSYPAVITLNEQLLLTASAYDTNNPNLITKLIPEHYLDEAAATQEISSDPDGTLMDGLSTTTSANYSIPGGAKLGQPQIISSLLFVWAREFDLIKVMIDHVSNLVFSEYDNEESIADQLLPSLAHHYGLELPSLFRNAKMNQFFAGEEVVDGKITKSLQFVQNEIWRRLLTNIREIIISKGTKHAMKAVFRASGIDPNRIFRFVEYGGTTTQRLGTAREKATEVSTLLDFSGSMTNTPSSEDVHGFYSQRPALQSVFLSASRVERGEPAISGQFFSGSSNESRDGLLTSGSWTIEARVKFPLTRDLTWDQSLFRFHTTASTGTPADDNPHRVLLNLVATPPTSRAVYADKEGEKLTLYCRPGFNSSAPLLALPLTGADIFDGKTWYISCGRKRSETIGSYVTSSYFLRAARQAYGDVAEYYTTSSYFAENDYSDQPGENLFQLTSSLGGQTLNASGAFLAVGTQYIHTGSGLHQLNDNNITNTARTSRFDGLWGHCRFWSRALDDDVAKEHVLNFKSLGVKNPLVNFGFSTDVSGSYEKLRLDISTDQPATESNSTGGLSLTDFSQNFNPVSEGGDGSGASLQGFETEKRIIKPERFDFSFLSPNYDEMPEQNKVRVAGFTQGKNLFEIGGNPAPVYEIVKSAEPVDDTRFMIEFSMMQALDKDIMNIFATLDALDLAIGAPELMFAEEYPDLARMREIYFNRLTEKINYKKLFDFFRWLDDSFDVILESLIPRKTNYLGFNFIIEGHGLERPKVAYGSGDVYLGESTRRNLKGIILLRQLVGDMRKF